MTPEQLEAIEGIGPKTVEKISIAVNNYFASLDGGEAVAAAEAEGTGEAATEAAFSEESLAEGSVEADALAAEPEQHRRSRIAGRRRVRSGEVAAEAEPAEAAPPKKPRRRSRD